MPSKKQSRKNTKVEKPTAQSTDDDYGCIVVKSNASSRSSTRSQKKVEPEPQPRIIPDWEKVGMTQEEFQVAEAKMQQQIRVWEMEKALRGFEQELQSIGYWQSVLDNLERCRERYNKKRGWSAADMQAVDEIDAEIELCEEQIYKLEGWAEDELVLA